MDLAHINVTNGVNEKGEPFLTVVATSTDKHIMIGQMSPQEVFDHAVSLIQAAEAAQQDAATYRVLRKVFEDQPDVADKTAAMIITELRSNR